LTVVFSGQISTKYGRATLGPTLTPASSGLGMTQEDICQPELLDANDRRSELRDGGIGRVACRQLHRAPPSPGERGFEYPVDELMTMQGVY
jgi:hypothetical protein